MQCAHPQGRVGAAACSAGGFGVLVGGADAQNGTILSSGGPPQATHHPQRCRPSRSWTLCVISCNGSESHGLSACVCPVRVALLWNHKAQKWSVLPEMLEPRMLCSAVAC